MQRLLNPNYQQLGKEPEITEAPWLLQQKESQQYCAWVVLKNCKKQSYKQEHEG